MSVLVTGMGGVGVNVARKFIDEGYKVICYDIAPRRGIDFLEKAGDKIAFVRGDILDLPYMLETVRSYQVEGIVHTAIIYPLPFETPNSVFRGTVEMQKDVLEVARLKDLKIISMSSEAVYGPQPNFSPMKEDDPTPRSWSTEPKWKMASLYVAIKVCCEQLMNAYYYVYGLDTVIVRSCEVFGPAEHTTHRSIPYFLMKALRRELINLESGGDHVKDYTYARDLADGLFSSYTIRPLKHRVFNITGGKLISLHEVAESAKEVVPEATIELGPGELKAEGETHRALRDHMNSIWSHGPCDISRARVELKYRPTPFKQAVMEYADYLRKQITPSL